MGKRATYIRGAADQGTSDRVISPRRSAVKVLEENIRNVHERRVETALGGVDGTIALVDANGHIIVAMVEGVICDVADKALAAAAADLPVRGDLGICSRPDLDPGAIARVGQGDVVNVQILNDIIALRVLAKGSNGDAV